MGSTDTGGVEQVPVTTVWARLAADSTAILIDVRTRAEWAFVGIADLTSLGRKPALVEWQSFPDSRANPAFVSTLSAELARLGAAKDTELFFICRSGGRSHMAAQIMADAGYTRCRNVAEGFEGPLDARGHRGTVSGWKVDGLPWTQG